MLHISSRCNYLQPDIPRLIVVVVQCKTSTEVLSRLSLTGVLTYPKLWLLFKGHVSSFVEVFCVDLFTFQPSVIQRHGCLTSTLLAPSSSLRKICLGHWPPPLFPNSWKMGHRWNLKIASLHDGAQSLLRRCRTTASPAHYCKDCLCHRWERVDQAKIIITKHYNCVHIFCHR